MKQLNLSYQHSAALLHINFKLLVLFNHLYLSVWAFELLNLWKTGTISSWNSGCLWTCSLRTYSVSLPPFPASYPAPFFATSSWWILYTQGYIPLSASSYDYYKTFIYFISRLWNETEIPCTRKTIAYGQWNTSIYREAFLLNFSYAFPREMNNFIYFFYHIPQLGNYFFLKPHYSSQVWQELLSTTRKRVITFLTPSLTLCQLLSYLLERTYLLKLFIHSNQPYITHTTSKPKILPCRLIHSSCFPWFKLSQWTFHLQNNSLKQPCSHSWSGRNRRVFFNFSYRTNFQCIVPNRSRFCCVQSKIFHPHPSDTTASHFFLPHSHCRNFELSVYVFNPSTSCLPPHFMHLFLFAIVQWCSKPKTIGGRGGEGYFYWKPSWFTGYILPPIAPRIYRKSEHLNAQHPEFRQNTISELPNDRLVFTEWPCIITTATVIPATVLALSCVS